MEDITDADYAHAKRDFEIINLRKYHGLYVLSNTLLIADVFENFRSMGFEIYKLDPAKIFLSSWISMARSFRKD